MSSRGFQSISVWVRFVCVAVVFLLVAQYVVNDRPWDHIFRLAALVSLVLAIVMFLSENRRWKRDIRSSRNK